MISREEYFSKRDPIAFPLWQKATIGIAGAGGLGSNIALSLARAGTGTLIIADYDIVTLENLNRQQYTLAQIGKLKVEALAENIHSFNPFINLVLHPVEITPANFNAIFCTADLLIEALDEAEQKEMLISYWASNFPNKHLIAASGLAGFGKNASIHTEHYGFLHIVGDLKSELKPEISPVATRVAVVANMQANLALELIAKAKGN
ncbi:MAG TPA: sulfur carrier protein ThiS adenylyltransferase ThiF [Candidatus Cloacimonas sp.]|nr:sulfur carrier protein ThiS adenylyltransferase ThiF [Candidatus Cloacimonas sp.]